MTTDYGPENGWVRRGRGIILSCLNCRNCYKNKAAKRESGERQLGDGRVYGAFRDPDESVFMDKVNQGVETKALIWFCDRKC